MEKTKTYENEVRVCIAIQKLGKATDEEIFNKLGEDKVKITLKQVAKATTNLQKRGLVSLNYDNSSGYAVKAYSMSKSIFSRDIPIAHYKDIVDTEDPDIKKLIEELEEKKKTSKGRLPDHRDYYMAEVTFEVVDKVLGFMPFKEEGFLQHYRQGDEIVLLPTHFRAWFAKNLRLINKSESVKNYIGFNYGKVKVKGKLTAEQFPILDGNQGKGINKFEAIPEGSTITTKFRVPSSDFKKTEFKEFLTTICEMPIRGLSGRAITGYGHLKITEYKTV
jgi:hypothetical protein